MGFHRCKPALIISLKCKNISGANPGLFSHEFSEKVCSSESPAGTLQMLHWLLRLPLGKAETVGLKGPIATDTGLRIFFCLLKVQRTLMRQTSERQVQLILVLLCLLKCSETQWCLWFLRAHQGIPRLFFPTR